MSNLESEESAEQRRNEEGLRLKIQHQIKCFVDYQ